uniref:Uncharacterized protein n=1 Tax=Ananas comosus var. bracteatus TaxID=296719 RepID=A0A6V7QVF0_ANACO
MEYCNIFEGVWVYDEAARPLYGEEDCPYIYDQLKCQAYGRPDRGYQHWRWQPRGCSLPSFDASAVLEMLRGKRMTFVGDSVNHGQFSSMVCLLHRIIPWHAKSFQSNGSLSVFKAKDYNASIEFYWAPFLVESNSDNAVARTGSESGSFFHGPSTSTRDTGRGPHHCLQHLPMVDERGLLKDSVSLSIIFL